MEDNVEDTLGRAGGVDVSRVLQYGKDYIDLRFDDKYIGLRLDLDSAVELAELVLSLAKRRW